MPSRHALSRRLLLGGSVASLSAPAFAQAWPSRPITLVVGYPPGGQTDFAARIVQNGISQALGQPIVVENRGGAGGNIGLEAVLRARPDGYTFLASNSSPMVINPHTFPPSGINPLDLVNICIILDAPLVYCVHPSVPAANAAELLAWIKALPRMIDYGIPAAGSLPHLAMEFLRSRTGLPEMQPIPYRGSGPALQDFLAGRFPVMTDSLSVMAPPLSGQQIRGIMVTSESRVPAFRNIPTAGEQGISDFIIGAWTGVSAPRGTPAEIVARMNEAVNQALRDPIVRERIAAAGAVVGGGTADTFDQRVRSDYIRWGEVARRNNITSR